MVSGSTNQENKDCPAQLVTLLEQGVSNSQMEQISITATMEVDLWSGEDAKRMWYNLIRFGIKRTSIKAV